MSIIAPSKPPADNLNSNVAPYIKAATADMKAYRDSKGYRPIPIGYAHADVQGLRPALQNYLTCGSNPAQSIDFFGLNCYEWCVRASPPPRPVIPSY